MVLGAWVANSSFISQANSILDIGTGTGVLALMAAQQASPLASIVAIDVDAAAVQTARENVAQSPWPSVEVLQSSLQDFSALSNTQFDLIICNPPFFAASSKPVGSARAVARHADVSLPLSDLATCCARLLAPRGSFCVVLPPSQAEELQVEALGAGLVLVRERGGGCCVGGLF
jgi:tRNA1Val (adenine37-N6)-methyltransferase